jgi:hypothetical protein
MRQLGAFVGALALGLMFAMANARYLRNFVSGPYPLSSPDLDAISDVATAPRYFARVEGTRTVDTGVEEFEVEKNQGREVRRTRKAGYFALEVGSRFLIVKAVAEPGTTVEGELVPIAAELDQHLFATPEMRQVRVRFYPYCLDTASFRTPGYWGLGIGAALALLVGGGAWRARGRLSDPASHPLLQRTASWGDPASVSGEIESEQARPWRRCGAITITDRYVVKSSFFSLDVVRLADLLWAYKRVTKKSVNFVPVGKDYHAVLACVGGTVEVQGKDAEVDEILHYVASKTPWAVFGHSKELEDLFRKDPAGFVAGVGERRRQHEAAQASA